MKITVWLVAALVAVSCGPADAPDERVRPVPGELSSELGRVHPTLVCSGDTCREARRTEPVSTLQGLSTLGYSTYLGFGGHDAATAVAVDSQRNVYITGCTNSFEGGAYNIFVAKMSPTGQNLYFTYFPGYCGHAIAVDSAGSAYVIGSFSSSPDDGSLVAKLNPSGSAFVYYNVLPLYLDGLTVDSQGSAYISGFYYVSASDGDVFVGKLNPAGSAFVYSVAFGGSGGEVANGIAVDGSGNAYVVGDTHSADFPVWRAYQPTLQGDGAAFVTKLNASGTGLLYSTFLGNQGPNPSTSLGQGIAVDAVGSAYVTGMTGPGFPVTTGAAQPFFGGGGADAYAAKFNAAGGLVYATYLGGSDVEWPGGIVVDASSGVAYVKGDTRSPNFPVTGTAFQPFLRGETDLFVTQIGASGSALLSSTYLGGSDWEYSNWASGTGLALDSARNVYVVGTTGSSDFPTNVYGPGGDSDAIVTRFNGQSW
jgi:hypothetical protein